MDFKHIPKEYRPIPFWSWNEKLDVEETKWQVRKMHEAGMGGFFMHARGGLQTGYMGEEWFENVEVSITAAKECGMRPWAYDERGWPSGFGDSKVNSLGVEYQQKYLCMEAEPVHVETAICKSGEHYFYYDINPFYVDNLDKKVVKKFIELAYEPYYERCGNTFEGFFTDEPVVSRRGEGCMPWSFVMEEAYWQKYGENLLEHLEELFLPVGDYKGTRVKYWKMVTDLFSEAYAKQIYDWCNDHGYKFTGHLLMEEFLHSQLFTNGACMPHYEYMHIPGMDWLVRRFRDCLTANQVSSVAEQFGKEAVLSETFAMCGHNVSFAELKGIYEWQMVRGINLLCQHLEGYSNRGIRKRDYPPALYIQQPWWCEYDKLNEALSRIGMILREGTHKVDVLVLHPQTSAWACFDGGENKGLEELNEAFLQVMKTLDENHVEYHLGDETIMERHGRVEEGRLVIGKQSYSMVIDPGCQVLLDNTRRLFTEFQAGGGTLIDAGKDVLPVNPVTDNKVLTYTKRQYDTFTVHYLVNSTANREVAEIRIKGKRLDIYSGDLLDFDGVHEFEPYGSLMLIEEACEEMQDCKNAATAQTDVAEKTVEDAAQTLIQPSGTFRIAERTPNSMTLDYCDYYFDGRLQEKNGYVLNIAERANELGRAVAVHQDYHVQADYVPHKLFLVCETPERFRIWVNGKEIDKTVQGYFVDKSFCKLDISDKWQLGENVISFDCVFEQSPEVYENLQKAKIFEGERNKLAYDMEIEPIYLLGDFSVRTDGAWTKLERNALRYRGSFVIDKPVNEVDTKHIQKQGYPFFCGEMILEGEIDIQGEHPVLDIDWKGLNALRVEIGGKEKVMLTDNRLSLKEFGVSGKTKVRFTLINNLRNLMGPHHLEQGESYAVRPASFYKEDCVWTKGFLEDWNDDYCFVEMSI